LAWDKMIVPNAQRYSKTDGGPRTNSDHTPNETESRTNPDGMALMPPNDEDKEVPIRRQGGKDVGREDSEAVPTDTSANDAYNAWGPRSRPTIGKIRRDRQQQQSQSLTLQNDSTVLSMVTDVFPGASLETESS
jgi:hypothetical protein